MIYVVMFIGSYLLLRLAEEVKIKQIRILIELIALLFPCLLAGARNENVGTDVRVYIKPYCNVALTSNNFIEYLNQRVIKDYSISYIKDMEVGFSAILYFTSKLTKNLFGPLFTIQAFTIIPIYLGLRRLRKIQSLSFSFLIYFFMFYNNSYNAMRQWIAMAFIFYGFTYLYENRTKQYFILNALAFLFHTSSIFGVGIYFIWKYMKNTESSKIIKVNNYKIDNSIMKLFIIFISGICILLSLNIFLKLLSTFGLSKYSYYINGKVTFLPNQLLVRFPILILAFINYKQWKENNKEVPFFISMMLLDLLASQLASVASYSSRIAFFFSIFAIISYPSLCQSFKSKLVRNNIKLFLVGYLFIYWYYYYVIKGDCATIPYLFST